MKSGLTLIELVFVAAIISVATLFTSGWYSRFLTQNAVDNTATQLVETMRKAQIYAMSGKLNSNWGVSYASNVITLYSVNTPAVAETFSVNSNVNITGFNNLEFYKTTGTPSATPSITIAGNNKTETILVNSQGVINR